MDITFHARRALEALRESKDRPAVCRPCRHCGGTFTLAELLLDDACQPCARLDALLEREDLFFAGLGRAIYSREVRA